MPRFKIHHITKYSYEVPVRDSANQVILYPIKDDFQEVLTQQLTITGDPYVSIYTDYYGNEVGSFMHSEPHCVLVIDSRIDVITHPKPSAKDSMNRDEQWDYLHQSKNQVLFIDFLKQEQFDALKAVQEVADIPHSRQYTPLEVATRLNEFVYGNFRYIKGITSVETTLDEVWQLKAGVCQDFAHMLLVTLRMIGIPARYVSGYICPNRSDMRGEGATHAWVEAYIPDYGWIGLDPTNNCIADQLHVRLALGRNFSDCSPVKGTYKGTSDHKLEVGVSVSYEDGHTQRDVVAMLAPQPAVKSNGKDNSYRRYVEMMQQQQQQ